MMNIDPASEIIQKKQAGPLTHGADVIEVAHANFLLVQNEGAALVASSEFRLLNLPGVVLHAFATGVSMRKDCLARLQSGMPMGIDDVPSDQIIAGTPEDCVRALQSVQALTGCDHVIADFGEACAEEVVTELLDAIALFRTEVLPAFCKNQAA